MEIMYVHQACLNEIAINNRFVRLRIFKCGFFTPTIGNSEANGLHERMNTFYDYNSSVPYI